jgi:hypothetical protein
MKTTTITKEQGKRLAAAWEIVNPAVPGYQDWKSPIAWGISTRHLDEHLAGRAGVTLEDVLDAIEFYTATAATVTEIGDMTWIKAPGYRNGPAGDH